MGHVEDRWTRLSGAVDSRGRPVREHTPRWQQGKRWLATWTADGWRRSQSFNTKDAALAKLAQVDVDQRMGVYIAPHRVTVTEYGIRWLAAQIHQRPSTAERVEQCWRLHIEPALGSIPLAEVSRSHVQAAVVAWSHDLSPATVGVMYGQLSSMMRAAAADRLLVASPCQRINLPPVLLGRVVPLSVDQVRKLADLIEPRYRGMVELAAATGMRSGELRGLTVDRLRWVDEGHLRRFSSVPGENAKLEGGEMLVRVDRQMTMAGFGPPKTPASDRTIRVDSVSAGRLREHVEAWPSTSGLVFTGAQGGPPTRGTLAKAWHRATGDDSPGAGWHQLRHFHASMLIAAGLSVVAVADRLGHRDSKETLATYAHLFGSDERRAVLAVQGLWAVQERGNESA